MSTNIIEEGLRISDGDSEKILNILYCISRARKDLNREDLLKFVGMDEYEIEFLAKRFMDAIFFSKMIQERKL